MINVDDIIFVDKVDTDNYIEATYFIESQTSLYDAAKGLAIGQSVGNPNVRSLFETSDLWKNYSNLIINDLKFLKEKKSGLVKIAIPLDNINLLDDGVSHLLCILMGGQLDIEIISKCQLLNLNIPQKFENYFDGPRYGIDGIREYINLKDEPLIGGIL